MIATTAFDSMAAEYDRSFTHSTLGQLMRQAVWQRLDANFAPGSRVLELNCGTGEDALYLARKGVRVLATDISAAMCALARQKMTSARLSDCVQVRQMAIEEIGEIRDWRLRPELVEGLEIGSPQSPISNLESPNLQTPNLPISNLQSPNLQSPFTGLLSNFGGLNCVSDLHKIAQDMAGVLQPGASVVLCIMGPLVPWEWLWYLRKGQPRKAFRRLGRDGVLWHDLRIRYPSARAVRRQFAENFRFLRASAVGALVPPSYAEAWAQKHPRALNALNQIERRFETHPVLTNFADHYVIEFERVAAHFPKCAATEHK